MTKLQSKLRGLAMEQMAENGLSVTKIHHNTGLNIFPVGWMTINDLQQRRSISLLNQSKLCRHFGIKCELIETNNK